MDLNEQGDWVKTVICPQCKNKTVVYNGNYWCALERCGWVMDDQRNFTNDAIIHAYLEQCIEEANRKGQAERLALLRWHLTNITKREEARARKASGRPRKIGTTAPKEKR